MSFVVCNSTCCPTDNKPPVAPKICEQNTKKYNYKHIIALDCSIVWTDIKDPTEWTTRITAGEISVFPKGIIAVNEPTETLVTIDNCGGEIPVDGEYLIDYVLPFVADGRDKSDETFFYNLKKKSGKYAIILLDDDGNFTMSQEFIDALNAGNGTVAGFSAGFKNSVTKTPYRLNEDGLMKWSTQFKLSEDDVLRTFKLAGVPEVLC